MTRGEGPKLKVSRGVKLFVCSLVEESLPVLQSTGKFDLSYSKVLGSQILKQECNFQIYLATSAV